MTDRSVGDMAYRCHYLEIWKRGFSVVCVVYKVGLRPDSLMSLSKLNRVSTKN